MNKKVLIPLIIASSLLNSQTTNHETEDNGKIALKCRRGYDHKGKTPQELEARRKRRKKLKNKRKAQKGIYDKKIKYKRRSITCQS